VPVFDDGSRAVGEGCESCDWGGFSRGGFGILGLRGAAELVGQGHNHVFPDPLACWHFYLGGGS